MQRALAVAAVSALIGTLVFPSALSAKRRADSGHAAAQTSAADDARTAPAHGRARPVDSDAAFVAAWNAFRKDDRRAFEAAARAAASHPLADYLDYWRLRMRLLASAQDPADTAVDADARDFVQRHEGTLIGDLARRDWLLHLGERGRWQSFDEQYARWILQDDDEVRCHAARGRIERGQFLHDHDAARTAFLSVRKPGKACFALVDAQLRANRIDRQGLREYLQIAIERNSVSAIRQLGLRLDMEAAAIEQALARPEQALSGKIPHDAALIALSRLARSDPGKADRWLDGSASALDEPDRAFLRAQIAAAAMRSLDARAAGWARRAIDAPVTDETRSWLARAALREQDWVTLKAVIGRMSDAGRADPAWMYWAARAERETGNPDRATAMLQTLSGRWGFYGQMASEDLGRQIDVPAPAAAASPDELRAAGTNAGFDRALRFYALGMRFEGNREWNFQLRGMDDRQLLAAAAWACARQIFDRCVNTADRTRSEHDFTLRFVAPFRDRMRPAAALADLDPAWVYGLIRQESRFIMDARSGVGARGLMQIMPATGRWIAGKLGETGFHPGKLHDLETNLRFGTFYLRTVLDGLEGSPVLAAAAYNAGPTRARRWQSSLTRPVEGAIFAETIPFDETRDYVKKVFSNSVYYAALFSGEAQSLHQRLGVITPRWDATARAGADR